MPLAVRVRSPIGRPERSRTISTASVPLAGQAHASRVSFLARPRTHTAGHEGEVE